METNPAALLRPEDLPAPLLVAAPHPDDESLACGGLIAAMRGRGADVAIIVMSDGAASHPASRTHPPARLAALRQDEALAAAAALGVAAERVEFWQLPDGAVPGPGMPGFAAAVARALERLRRLRPGLVAIPAAADAHADHRATAAIWTQALAGWERRARVLDYLVWPGAAPAAGVAVDIDIAAVLPRKRQAIAAHRSQLGDVIADDPFALPPALLARATQPVERFFERGA